MNTPAHVIINLLVLGQQDTPRVLTPVVIGSLLPDAPMFVFYFVEKVIKGTPEAVIWREEYYRDSWQDFIDVFNSLPLILLGLVGAIWLGHQMGTLLFSSMLLHVLGDLPLHHHDAHRHFFPLSNWRFHSPVSYWDPNFHGSTVLILEILAVILSCIFLLQSYESVPGRVSVALVAFSYVSYSFYAFTVWL